MLEFSSNDIFRSCFWDAISLSMTIVLRILRHVTNLPASCFKILLLSIWFMLIQKKKKSIGFIGWTPKKVYRITVYIYDFGNKSHNFRVRSSQRHYSNFYMLNQGWGPSVKTRQVKQWVIIIAKPLLIDR